MACAPRKVWRENMMVWDDDDDYDDDEIGIVTKNEIIIDKEPILHIDELKSYNTNWLTNFMG